MNAETLTLDGITYEVTLAKTVADVEADGHANTARMMREHGQIRQLYMKRPNGKVMYYVTEFAPKPGYKNFSKVVSLGSW